MADYDIVFVGYPIWGGDIPPAVRTFPRQRGYAESALLRCNVAVNGAGVDQYGENVTAWLEEVANETGSVFCSGLI